MTKKITKLMHNGEEYLIREYQGGGGWQPGANTIAYWKLNGDLTDEMGNYDGTTAGSATITYESLPGDSSIKCAKVYSAWWDDGIGLPASICNEIFVSNVDITFGCFINISSLTDDELLYLQTPSGTFTCSVRSGDFYTDMAGQNYWNTTANLNTNTWYSIVWTYDNSTYTWKYYINGNLIDTVTKNQNYTTSSTADKAYLARKNDNTFMSNAVLETNTARSQQDVILFHDTFKSLYGIS